MKKRNINHFMIRGIILLGFTILLIRLVLTGDLKFFIAPKMAPLTYFSIVAFLLMGIGQFWKNKTTNDDKHCDCNCKCGIDHGTSNSGKKSIIIYSLFIIPILTGIFFSNNTLDSAIAANRGVDLGNKMTNLNTSKSYNSNISQFSNSGQETYDVLNKNNTIYNNLVNSKKITVNDDYFTFTMNTIAQRLDLFLRKEIEYDGFVYRPDGFPHNQIVVARFGIYCCIADANIVGLLSTGNVSNLKDNEWVKVDGILDMTHYQGAVVPALRIKTIQKIPKPSDPYVYFK
ncbi:TIGR03943 family protein [Bacillus sp. RG28]|uniref:TIGR03943 family protein n=1 Tax=Gottfriedia endophytica TaxID=2820819 RepID=A0A940NLI3_9BACI|nr:TIGR03943 family protein [Gottfriedia endophytica]MBP0726670.1 TIGR03943 family protein [Gottfriedia endophytica]